MKQLKLYEELINKKIADTFIKSTNGVISLKIYNSTIEYIDPFYVVKNSNGKILASEITSYDIAVLIAEEPKFAHSAISVDNIFSKYYNDIIYYRAVHRISNDNVRKEIISAKYEESKIKLLSTLKTAIRMQWIIKNLDKYTK